MRVSRARKSHWPSATLKGDGDGRRRFDDRDPTNLRLDATNQRLDATNQRLNLVEAAILDLSEQHRFVVRYTKAIADRDGQLEPRVSALESRVDKLESK